MKIINLKIHSFVGLITNSSTEIYVTCTEKSVELIKEFINEILKSSNNDKNVDDLFDIKCWMYDYDDDGNEIRTYDVDFDHETNPVYLEIISKTNNKDLTNLIKNVFESKEFMS